MTTREGENRDRLKIVWVARTEAVAEAATAGTYAQRGCGERDAVADARERTANMRERKGGEKISLRKLRVLGRVRLD
jgi:hypothetical protein